MRFHVFYRGGLNLGGGRAWEEAQAWEEACMSRAQLQSSRTGGQRFLW